MDYDEIELEMMAALETMDNRLTSIRAGRANPSMVNGIMVDYYGSPTPLQSLANLTVPEARTLMIKPFDKSCLKDIVKAIAEANIGINPTDNGECVILTVPQLNEERRKEYVKQAKQISEDAKVALRKVRQEAREAIEKDESITEDEEKRLQDDIQNLINEYNKKVEEKLAEKEEELMTV
jgi:ribosome recycling factor